VARPRMVTFWFRLLRDVAESRKPLPTLLRRGWGLMRAEPALVARWTALGCRPLSPVVAEREIRRVAESVRTVVVVADLVPSLTHSVVTRRTRAVARPLSRFCPHCAQKVS
jgi:hypothetical protein